MPVQRFCSNAAIEQKNVLWIIETELHTVSDQIVQEVLEMADQSCLAMVMQNDDSPIQ